MAKQYLKPGRKISLNAYARVGSSGTVVDVAIDWGLTVAAGATDGVGEVVDDEDWTYDVFLEESTGRLWYDDERGR